MTEWEKGQQGYLYDANNDPEVLALRTGCADLCHAFNLTRPSDTARQKQLMRQILGSIRGDFTITQPFYCDYGFNISIGEQFYANHNCVILDAAQVSFGDHVFLAPNCVITAAGHATDAAQRAAGLEIARPVTVGDHVWIGANVTVLPGVTIGDDVIIGAGSVVNRDIPSHVVAAGNPCRVIRPITPEDQHKYPIWAAE